MEKKAEKFLQFRTRWKEAMTYIVPKILVLIWVISFGKSLDKVFVEKYVTRFDVSMNYMRHMFFMKECETPTNTRANSRSFGPVQFDICTPLICKSKEFQMIFKFSPDIKRKKKIRNFPLHH